MPAPIFSVDPSRINPPGDHSIEEEFLRDVRLGVMDERDLRGRTPALTSLERTSSYTLNRSGSGVERSLKTS